MNCEKTLTKNYLHSDKKLIVKKEYKCEKCYYFSEKKTNLIRHIQTMHEMQRDFYCCDLRFKTKADYREHSKSVHKFGHMCSTCNRVFARRALLTRHLNIHIPGSAREFICAVCSYATSHKSNLIRHLKIHNIPSESSSSDSASSNNNNSKKTREKTHLQTDFVSSTTYEQQHNLSQSQIQYKQKSEIKHSIKAILGNNINAGDYPQLMQLINTPITNLSWEESSSCCGSRSRPSSSTSNYSLLSNNSLEFVGNRATSDSFQNIQHYHHPPPPPSYMGFNEDLSAHAGGGGGFLPSSCMCSMCCVEDKRQEDMTASVNIQDEYISLNNITSGIGESEKESIFMQKVDTAGINLGSKMSQNQIADEPSPPPPYLTKKLRAAKKTYF